MQMIMNEEVHVDNMSEQVEKITSTRKMFYYFGAPCGLGFVLLMLGVFLLNLDLTGVGLVFVLLGYGLIALPTFLGLAIKVGPFVEVGPVLSTSTLRVGNVIYETVSRDYMSQAGANIVFTLIKCFLIFLVSLVLTPLITIVLYITCNKQYKKTIKYAEENNIDKTTIPAINKKMVLITFIIFVALVIASIIGCAVTDSANESKNEENLTKTQEILNTIVTDKLPDEYYGEIYRNDTVQNGDAFIAKFAIGETVVYCGEVGTNFGNDYTYLSSSTTYYIMVTGTNVDIYINQLGYGTPYIKYTISDVSEEYEFLMKQYLETCIGENATVTTISYTSNDVTHFDYQYNDNEYGIWINSTSYEIKKISYQTQFKDGYLQLQLDADFDLSALKTEAQQLINN